MVRWWDDEQKTALMEASSWGRTEVVSQLISAGADVAIPDKEGVGRLCCGCWMRIG